jgi:xylulokinase
MGAALGLGLREGDIAISLGTSGTVFAVSSDPTHDASGAVAGFADAAGRFLPLACTLNATKVTDTMARLLGRERVDLERLALESTPGARGLVLLPYFDGERTPNLPDATGVLSGLRSDTEPAQLARAAYEGVVCGLLDALDALRDAGVPTDDGRVLVVGGGARSAVYPRLIADLLQRPVEVPPPAEYVARGACVQAVAAATGRDVAVVSAEWAPADALVVEPDASVDAAAVRGAYAHVRQRTHPHPGDAA